MATLKPRPLSAVGTGLAFPVRHWAAFLALAGLWAGLALAGLDYLPLALLVCGLGFPLTFHRVLTPQARLGWGLAQGVLSGIGALLFTALVMTAVVVVAAAFMDSPAQLSDLRAIIYSLLLLVSLILPLSVLMTMAPVSFHDRRLRGLKTWRTAYRNFPSFLGTTVLLGLGLVALLIAEFAVAALIETLFQPSPKTWPAIEAVLVGLVIAYAVAMTAGTMAGLAAQTLDGGAGGVAEVFD